MQSVGMTLCFTFNIHIPSLPPSGLANSEHNHPAGLLLKTNVLLQHDGDRQSGRLEVKGEIFR